MSLDLTFVEATAARSVNLCDNISAHEAFLLSRLKEPTPIGKLKSTYRDLFDFDGTLDALVKKGCVTLSQLEQSQSIYTIPLRGSQAKLVAADFRAKRAWIEVRTGDPMRKVLYRLNWGSGEVERVVGASKPSLMSAVTFVFSPSPDSREQAIPEYRLGPEPIATSKSGIHRIYARNPEILASGMFYVSEVSGMSPLKLEAEGVTGEQPIFNPDDSGCVAWLQTFPTPAVMVSEPYQSARKILDLPGTANIVWKSSKTLVVLCHTTGDIILVDRRGGLQQSLTCLGRSQRGMWIDPIQRTIATVGDDLVVRWVSLGSGTLLERVKLTTSPDAAMLRENGVLVTLHKDNVSIVRLKDRSVSILRERIHPSSFSAYTNSGPNQPLLLMKNDRFTAELIQVQI